MADTLFDKAEFALPAEESAAEVLAGVPRLRVPQRQQVKMHYAALDELLESDHPVRALVLTLDLSA